MMDALVLLCDFAEVINNKLYVMGGGWTDVLKVQPLTFAVGARLEVPYDQTNTALLVEARLLDVDGHPVILEEREVTIQARVEVGRPPGIKKGAPLAVPLAWRFDHLDLAAGSYAVHVTVESEVVARATFNVYVPQTNPFPTPTQF